MRVFTGYSQACRYLAAPHKISPTSDDVFIVGCAPSVIGQDPYGYGLSELSETQLTNIREIILAAKHVVYAKDTAGQQLRWNDWIVQVAGCFPEISGVRFSEMLANDETLQRHKHYREDLVGNKPLIEAMLEALGLDVVL